MAQTNANLIWKIADLLRGPYQPNQCGHVILPFTIPVVRREDAIESVEVLFPSSTALVDDVIGGTCF
jgi:hypothetical protein